MQRVPAGEKRGRRHTSTVVVAVLDVDDVVPASVVPADVRVDTFRASGPGGQHRNKTSSAVRVTHVPTGTVVTATEDRDQRVNRRVAFDRLRQALDLEAAGVRRDEVNMVRAASFGAERLWVWCGWRDEVIAPDGRRMSMRRALRGRVVDFV